MLLAWLGFFDRLALHGFDCGAAEQGADVNLLCGPGIFRGSCTLLRRAAGRFANGEWDGGVEKSAKQDAAGLPVIHGMFPGAVIGGATERKEQPRLCNSS